MSCMAESVAGELACPKPGVWTTDLLPYTGLDLPILLVAGVLAFVFGVLLVVRASR